MKERKRTLLDPLKDIQKNAILQIAENLDHKLLMEQTKSNRHLLRAYWNKLHQKAVKERFNKLGVDTSELDFTKLRA